MCGSMSMATGKSPMPKPVGTGAIIRCGSEGGGLPLEDGRLALYSEAGKHAFAPSPRWLLQRKAKTLASCGGRAGAMGLHVTPLFAGLIGDDSPQNNRLAHTYLERRQFEPSYSFSQLFDLRRARFVPWPSLLEWIPRRVAAWLDHLGATIPPGAAARLAHRPSRRIGLCGGKLAGCPSRGGGMRRRYGRNRHPRDSGRYARCHPRWQPQANPRPRRRCGGFHHGGPAPDDGER